jgi:signal transduction histidine kinase
MSGGQERAPMRDGVGIYGIRARARQLGGDLTIRTGPHGTAIHVLVRVRQAESITDANDGEHGVI